MAEKYLLFNLEDEQAKKLGDVISNSTSRKIVNLLSEQEASEADIAKKLGIPVNTAEYNLKKLLEAGVVEKSKEYFWSSKGKRISIYKVANKLIVISPKKTNVYSKLKSIVPVVLISGILALLAGWYSRAGTFVAEKTSEAGEGLMATSVESMPKAVQASTSAAVSAGIPVWAWFLAGSLVAIIVFLIFSWKKL